MFGYVTIDKQEMKFREFDLYRAAYCGLCHVLREKYGFSGQLSLTYDMTFVVLLLEGLYEPEVTKEKGRCIVHPAAAQPLRKSTVTDYCADMNVLLCYYKCMDDWNDERKILRRAYAGLLSGKMRKVREKYPRKSAEILKYLNRLSDMEKAGNDDIDAMSGCFGHIMEEIFVWKEDCWEESLRRMGFFLGKYIYLLDAYEDLEKDKKEGAYNVFSKMSGSKGFDSRVKDLLTMMMAESCRAFEKLPIITNVDILRNILYSGVWTKYRAVIRKHEKQEKSND